MIQKVIKLDFFWNLNKNNWSKVLDYDWGIISVKFQDTVGEIPMDPITAMRNALGAEEGGSGVPLDKETYLKSVAFWKDHVVLS